MSTLTDIWLGYTNTVLGNNATPVKLLVDFFLLAIVFGYLLTFINSRQGWRYILALIIGLILLIGGDYFGLRGVHVLAQALLIILVVAAPLVFKDKLLPFFRGEPGEPIKTSAPTIALAVILAAGVALAGYGTTTKLAQLSQTVPITATNLATGLSARLGTDNAVTLMVLAPRSTWSTLAASDFSATVDTGAQNAGTYELPVSVTSKIAGLKVVTVSPSTVSVAIEPIIKKSVPVAVKFNGSAGNNLVPDSPVVDHDHVDISGPSSLIHDITQVIAPVRLNGEITAIEQKVSAVVQDTGGNTISGITIDPPQIDVKANLIKPGITKTVGVLPVLTGQPKTGFWVNGVSTDPAAVTITGSPALLEKINKINTQPVSVSGIGGNSTLTALLVLPTGITLTDTSITKASVNITLSKVSTTKTVTPQLSYSGLADALKVSSTNPMSLTAVVSGPSDLLSSLSDSSVKVSLNLSVYQSAGTYSLVITGADITTPTGIGLVSFLPSAISVTLENK